MLAKLRAFVASEPVLTGAVFTLVTVLLTRLLPGDELVANVVAVVAAVLGVAVPAVVARSKVTPEHRAQARVQAAVHEAVHGPPDAQL